MSGSSRLDGRQHVQTLLQIESRDAAETTHSRLGHNSNYDTLGSTSSFPGISPRSDSLAVDRTPEPPPAQAPAHDRQPSRSPISTGLAPVSQEHLEPSDTQTTSQTQLSPEPSPMSIKSTGQQVMSEALTSDTQPNRSSGPVPGNPDHHVAPKTAGGVKPLADTVRSVDDLDRRRSRSIGSLSRESRIAALSVHLRTRLSYAAAKIEKSRRTHGVQGHLSPSTESLVKIGLLPALGEIEAQRLETSSPGTTMSAPDPPASFNLHTSNGSRLSPVAQSVDGSPPSSHLDPPRSHTSIHLTRPKLAPPADIIASGGSSRRRRPNPNEAIPKLSTSLHRRHRSQQEFGVSRPATHSEKVLVPGTPPLRPSRTAPYSGAGSHARSSAMEQDAIETLLFMSSPGHSGYHSSSQHSQPHQNVFPSSDPRGSDVRVPQSQDSHASSYRGQSIRGSHGQELGLEAQAGDAIDRMLDQMDSDSDDDIKFASNSSRPDSSERTKYG